MIIITIIIQIYFLIIIICLPLINENRLIILLINTSKLYKFMKFIILQKLVINNLINIIIGC